MISGNKRVRQKEKMGWWCKGEWKEREGVRHWTTQEKAKRWKNGTVRNRRHWWNSSNPASSRHVFRECWRDFSCEQPCHVSDTRHDSWVVTVGRVPSNRKSVASFWTPRQRKVDRRPVSKVEFSIPTSGCSFAVPWTPVVTRPDARAIKWMFRTIIWNQTEK